MQIIQAASVTAPDKPAAPAEGAAPTAPTPPQQQEPCEPQSQQPQSQQPQPQQQGPSGPPPKGIEKTVNAAPARPAKKVPELIYRNEQLSQEELRAQLPKYKFDKATIKAQLQDLDQSIEARLSKFLS